MRPDTPDTSSATLVPDDLDLNLSVDTTTASNAAAALMREGTPNAASTPMSKTFGSKRKLNLPDDQPLRKKLFKGQAAVDKFMNMTSDLSSLDDDSDTESIASLLL